MVRCTLFMKVKIVLNLCRTANRFFLFPDLTFFIFQYFTTSASSLYRVLAHKTLVKADVCLAPFLGKSGAQNNIGHCAANRQLDDENQTSIQPHTRLQF